MLPGHAGGRDYGTSGPLCRLGLARGLAIGGAGLRPRQGRVGLARRAPSTRLVRFRPSGPPRPEAEVWRPRAERGERSGGSKGGSEGRRENFLRRTLKVRRAQSLIWAPPVSPSPAPPGPVASHREPPPLFTHVPPSAPSAPARREAGRRGPLRNHSPRRGQVWCYEAAKTTLPGYNRLAAVPQHRR